MIALSLEEFTLAVSIVPTNGFEVCGPLMAICEKDYIVQELTNGSPECQTGQSPKAVAKVTSFLYNPFFKNCAQF